MQQWMAYYELEPWGEVRADIRAGTIAATIHNCHITKKEHAKSPADFMPKFDQAPVKRAAITTPEGWKSFKSSLVAISNSQRRAAAKKRRDRELGVAGADAGEAVEVETGSQPLKRQRVNRRPSK